MIDRFVLQWICWRKLVFGYQEMRIRCPAIFALGMQKRVLQWIVHRKGYSDTLQVPVPALDSNVPGLGSCATVEVEEGGFFCLSFSY